MSIESDFSDRASAAEMLANAGVINDPRHVPAFLQVYVTQADRALHNAREMVVNGELGIERELEFGALLVEIGARVNSHPIIKENRYLKRFAQGVTMAQARHELQQFSVFAHNFDVAQAMPVTNAPTFEAYQKRLQVLLNEKGIPYANGFEGELTGRWKQETVHFQWLLNMAEGLELTFAEVGKIWVALPGTKVFVEAVFKYYATVDQCVSLGAAFAVENWAANYLWTPWIAGMKKLNVSLKKKINLGYLVYHQAEERHHSQSTIDELLDEFIQPGFDSQRFLQGAEGILNEGVLPYYASQLEHVPDKQNGAWPTTVCTATDRQALDGELVLNRPILSNRIKPLSAPGLRDRTRL